MIATHNVKVNGRWYHAGENIPVSEAVKVLEKKEEAPVKEDLQVSAEAETVKETAPEKEQEKPKAAPRRKKISE